MFGGRDEPHVSCMVDRFWDLKLELEKVYSTEYSLHIVQQ